MARLPSNDQYQAFEFRPNVGQFQGWGGVISEGDPGSIPSNRLRRVLNMRFQRGTLRSRPGLEVVLDLDGNAYGRITHMGQHARMQANRLWYSVNGCFHAAAGGKAGATIYNYDPDRYAYNIESAGEFIGPQDTRNPFGIFGDRLYIGDTSAIRQVSWPWIQPSDTHGVQFNSVLDNPMLLDKTYHIRWMVEFDSKLFIGVVNATTPANSKIQYWDGLSFKDDVTGIPATTNACILRDTLVVADEAGGIRWRNRGDSVSRTWTAVAGAGFTSTLYLNSMAEYREAVYIASGGEEIWKWDGASLTNPHSLPAGGEVHAIARHKGLLYYGHRHTYPDTSSFVGRIDFDNTVYTWIDTYVDLSGMNSEFGYLSSMISCRDDLWVGGANLFLFHSPPYDILGNWIDAGMPPGLIRPPLPGHEFAPVQLVVY